MDKEVTTDQTATLYVNIFLISRCIPCLVTSRHLFAQKGREMAPCDLSVPPNRHHLLYPCFAEDLTAAQCLKTKDRERMDCAFTVTFSKDSKSFHTNLITSTFSTSWAPSPQPRPPFFFLFCSPSLWFFSFCSLTLSLVSRFYKFYLSLQIKEILVWICSGAYCTEKWRYGSSFLTALVENPRTKVH